MKICEGLKKFFFFILAAWVGKTWCHNSNCGADLKTGSNHSSVLSRLRKIFEPIIVHDVKVQFISKDGTLIGNQLATIEFGPLFQAREDPRKRQRKPREWPKGDSKAPIKVPELITAAGRDFETHRVTTDDGYELTLFRLKRDTRCDFPNSLAGEKTSYLFQHGIFGTAADWLVAEPENSFPLILNAFGLDVWLGNSRGNEYSMRHKWLKPTQPAFWNFSFNKMGRHDFPAVLDHILKTTKDESTEDKSNKIQIVGHSMGTTIFYVCMSLFAEKYQNHVDGIFALAPSAFLSRMTTPLRELLPLVRQYRTFQNDGPFLPSMVNSYLHLKVPELCRAQKNNRSICSLVGLFASGDDSQDISSDTWTRVYRQFPSTTSVKTVVHYLQQVEKDEFREFDYGLVKNMIAYDQPVPPQYNLFNITFSNINIYGQKDLIVDSQDVERTIRETATGSNGQANVLLMDSNHLDFIYGDIGPILVYVVANFAYNAGSFTKNECNQNCIRDTNCKSPQAS